MKILTNAVTFFFLTSSVAFVSARAAEPGACSVVVSVTTQLGTYRTWTNALETAIFENKGFGICQDDGSLDEPGSNQKGCQTEFKLELLFRSDGLTRNVTISKGARILFDRDYAANPYPLGSLKILRTIPSCAELQKLAAPTGN